MILKNSIAFNFVLLTPASWLSTLQKSQTVCWKLEVAAFSSEALLHATTCTLAQFAHLLWGDIEFQANWQQYAAISSGWVDWWEFAAYQHLTRLVVDGFLFWSKHLLHEATSFLCSCCGITMGFPRQVGRRKYLNTWNMVQILFQVGHVNILFSAVTFNYAAIHWVWGLSWLDTYFLY